MGPKHVVSPAGEAWSIRRCWLPKRKLRWRHMARTTADGSPHGTGVLDFVNPFDLVFSDNPLIGILLVVAFLAVGVVAWFFLVPLLLALLDVVILIALAAAGVVGHLLLHRPWQIEASNSVRTVDWKVIGWRRSGRVIDAVARQLHDGGRVPADAGELLTL